MTSQWPEKLQQYFNVCLANDLENNFRKLDERRFPIYLNHKSMVNTGSEAFHSSFKRVSGAEKINRTEHVVIALFIEQLHKLYEFNRSFTPFGTYSIKPELKHLSKQVLPLVNLNFENLLANVKKAVGESEPEVLSNQYDNYTEKKLARMVIDSQKIVLVEQMKTLVVEHPFKDEKALVSIQTNGDFHCTCKAIKKVDCFHRIAAKLFLNSTEKIKQFQPWQRFSQIKRTYTKEKKGGKKQPRLLDVDTFDEDKQVDEDIR